MKRILTLLLAVLSLAVFAETIPTNSAERAKLAKQLTRSIPLELGKVEGTLPQINILMKKGEKAQARVMVDKALRQIAKIEADQKTLAEIDETADEETLMLDQVQEVKQYLVNKANLLRNAIGLNITCDAKLFDADYPTFLKDLKGELSKQGVCFVDSIEQADWSITIKATSREYNTIKNGEFTTYFAYVDAQLSIDKMANGKRIYEDAMSAKGGHTHNYDKAAREAFRDLVPVISSIIKEHIQK